MILSDVIGRISYLGDMLGQPVAPSGVESVEMALTAVGSGCAAPSWSLTAPRPAPSRHGPPLLDTPRGREVTVRGSA